MGYEFFCGLPIAVVVGLMLVFGAFAMVSQLEDWIAIQWAKISARPVKLIERYIRQETQPRERSH